MKQKSNKRAEINSHKSMNRTRMCSAIKKSHKGIRRSNGRLIKIQFLQLLGIFNSRMEFFDHYQVKIMKNEEQKQVAQIFNLNSKWWSLADYKSNLHPITTVLCMWGTKSIALAMPLIDQKRTKASVAAINWRLEIKRLAIELLTLFLWLSWNGTA